MQWPNNWELIMRTSVALCSDSPFFAFVHWTGANPG